MNKILYGIFNLLGILNKIIYKKSNRIVLYSNLGFRDNTKAIYNYLVENKYNEKYKIICSTNDYKKFKDISLKNVIFISNYLGIFYYLTSKYFMYSFGKYPIVPSKKQEVINLWHGSPLKNIGNLEKGKENIKYNYFSKILVTSDLFGNIMKKAFKCTDNELLICGQPRNDALFINYAKQIKNKKKLILWLPTFRNHHLNEIREGSNNDLPFFNGFNEMAKLNEYLESNDSELIIKLHLRQKEMLNNYEFNNVKIYTDEDFSAKGLELYEVLSYSDALITDYSSVYFDYLLLNRPIGFIINDINEYSEERGFVFDNPIDLMPGSKIFDKKQFYDFINNVAKNEDNYKKSRKKINQLANFYTDGENCKRALRKIGI